MRKHFDEKGAVEWEEPPKQSWAIASDIVLIVASLLSI
jgi:hypothetical protein